MRAGLSRIFFVRYNEDQVKNNESLSHFIEDCGKNHIRIEDLQITKPGKKSENVIAILILHFEKKTSHSETISKISSMSGVSFVEEL